MRIFAHDARAAHLVGTTIAREWKGVRHEVRVLADGYEYDGKVYGSLSAVGKQITGSSTNGFAFFGLDGGKPREARPRTVAAAPAEGGDGPRVAPAEGGDGPRADGRAQDARSGIVMRPAEARRRQACANCGCDHQAPNPKRHGCYCGVACGGPYEATVVHYVPTPGGRAACGASDHRPETRSWMRAFANCLKCLSEKE